MQQATGKAEGSPYLPFRTLASSSVKDREGHRIVRSALAQMRASGRIDLLVGSSHASVEQDAASIIGDVLPDTEHTNPQELIMDGRLYASDPRAQAIYSIMEHRPESLAVSISGRIPEGGMRKAADGVLEVTSLLKSHCMRPATAEETSPIMIAFRPCGPGVYLLIMSLSSTTRAVILRCSTAVPLNSIPVPLPAG